MVDGMQALLRKPPSVYGLLALGLILVIEPALPQYHFSLFWFSLGVIGTLVAVYDLVRKPR
jgi:hypothetical protein